MKKYLLLLFTISLASCVDYRDGGTIRCENIQNKSISIVEIDSCEYIKYKEGYEGSISHKGNCKHCIKRNKNE